MSQATLNSDQIICNNSYRLATLQPIGIYRLPAGLLLVEANESTKECLTQLIAGKIPSSFPDTMTYFEKALAGDSTGALSLIAGDSEISNYNRFVLDSTPLRLEALRQSESNEISKLANAVAYIVGISDEVSHSPNPVGVIDAMVVATCAASHIQAGEMIEAASDLNLAIIAAKSISPLFGAQLEVNLAQVLMGIEGRECDALDHYESALRILENSDLATDTAQVHFEVGMYYQALAQKEPTKLTQAVQSYHRALRLLSRTQEPELYGALQVNLALAYLAMPMVEASDALRYGVAISCLKEALKVFDQESHPSEWVNAKMNLANALVYAPSAHQGDNLVEAVETYEELLSIRDRMVDPLGYARLCANQGNALAHLGVFDHAKAKLHEARMIFEEFSHFDEVMAIRDLIDVMARQRAASDERI